MKYSVFILPYRNINIASDPDNPNQTLICETVQEMLQSEKFLRCGEITYTRSRFHKWLFESLLAEYESQCSA